MVMQKMEAAHNYHGLYRYTGSCPEEARSILRWRVDMKTTFHTDLL